MANSYNNNPTEVGLGTTVTLTNVRPGSKIIAWQMGETTTDNHVVSDPYNGTYVKVANASNSGTSTGVGRASIHYIDNKATGTLVVTGSGGGTGQFKVVEVLGLAKGGPRATNTWVGASMSLPITPVVPGCYIVVAAVGYNPDVFDTGMTAMPTYVGGINSYSVGETLLNDPTGAARTYTLGAAFVTQGQAAVAAFAPARPVRKKRVINASGIASNSATLAQTLAALTLTGASTLSISATVAKTLAALTLAGNGNLTITGTLANTLGALVLAGNGTLAISGTLAQTLGALTLAAADTASNTGALSSTLANVTLAGNGTLTITGALGQTLGAMTIASAATLGISATLAKTLGTLTLVASDGGAVTVTVSRLRRTILLSPLSGRRYV